MAVRRVGEEKLAVEHLWEELIQIDARHFPAEAQHMLVLHPAHRIDHVVVVLRLVLVGKGRRANLKTRAGKHKFINGIRDAVGGAIDAQVRDSYGGNVVQLVVDVHESEP